MRFVAGVKCNKLLNSGRPFNPVLSHRYAWMLLVDLENVGPFQIRPSEIPSLWQLIQNNHNCITYRLLLAKKKQNKKQLHSKWVDNWINMIHLTKTCLTLAIFNINIWIYLFRTQTLSHRMHQVYHTHLQSSIGHLSIIWDINVYSYHFNIIICCLTSLNITNRKIKSCFCRFLCINSKVW